MRREPDGHSLMEGMTGSNRRRQQFFQNSRVHDESKRMVRQDAECDPHMGRRHGAGPIKELRGVIRTGADLPAGRGHPTMIGATTAIVRCNHG